MGFVGDGGNIAIATALPPSSFVYCIVSKVYWVKPVVHFVPGSSRRVHQKYIQIKEDLVEKLNRGLKILHSLLIDLYLREYF